MWVSVYFSIFKVIIASTWIPIGLEVYEICIMINHGYWTWISSLKCSSLQFIFIIDIFSIFVFPWKNPHLKKFPSDLKCVHEKCIYPKLCLCIYRQKCYFLHHTYTHPIHLSNHSFIVQLLWGVHFFRFSVTFCMPHFGIEINKSTISVWIHIDIKCCKMSYIPMFQTFLCECSSYFHFLFSLGYR